MAEVFVDTVAWLALVNTSDALHEPALRTMQQLRSQRAWLTTTEFTLSDHHFTQAGFIKLLSND